MVQLTKKIGLGSLSLLLFIFGLLFAMSFKDICYGDVILRSMGLKAWSNGMHGFHLTIFYSLIFFVPALVLGYKFKTNLGAVSGKKLSLFACVIIVLLILLFSVSPLL